MSERSRHDRDRLSCPNCGAEVKPGSAFCASCGERLAPTPEDAGQVSPPDPWRTTPTGGAPGGGPWALASRLRRFLTGFSKDAPGWGPRAVTDRLRRSLTSLSGDALGSALRDVTRSFGRLPGAKKAAFVGVGLLVLLVLLALLGPLALLVVALAFGAGLTGVIVRVAQRRSVTWRDPPAARAGGAAPRHRAGQPPLRRGHRGAGGGRGGRRAGRERALPPGEYAVPHHRARPRHAAAGRPGDEPARGRARKGARVLTQTYARAISRPRPVISQ